jgi:plastocyanin
MLRNFLVATLAATVTACSGSAPAAPSPQPGAGTTPPAAPSGPATVTITANGMSPLEATINVGQRVVFVNNDSRAHDVVGGRDPGTPDCPEITQAGFLTPGQRGETGVFTRAQTCEYHDHSMMGVPAFQGRIIIR